MLSRLYIENIAVIERAEIEYSPGLNIMTGETGAGKSILVDSLMAVMGERTSRELIRSGSDSAIVSAEFTDVKQTALERLAELGIEPDDGAITLGRELKSDGRGVCRINGRPVAASLLRQAGRLLVNIHGQHDTQSLIDQTSHLRYIDAIMDDDAVMESYRKAYRSMCETQKELSSLEVDEAEKARRIDMLTYQINDIESAALRVGEADKLKKLRDRCRSYERICAALRGAFMLLSGDEDTGGAGDMLREAMDDMESISDLHSDFSALYTRLRDAFYEVGDIKEELSAQLDSMDFDPARLNAIEDRLDVIGRVMRKYGTEQEALDYCESAREELSSLEYADEKKEKLAELLGEYKKLAQGAAARLTRKRRETGERFGGGIKEELAFLDMPGVDFVVDVSPKELGSDGGDRVEFLISANPGEPPKPISKIASGGELSRIMLAIKNVMAGCDDIDTLIFDEVDTGVSGRAAYKIGVKLKEASRARQIICITHQAQIAAIADTHMLIKKEVANARAFTSVCRLDREERVRELARINGGESITQSQLDTAREMLDQAQAKK